VVRREHDDDDDDGHDYEHGGHDGCCSCRGLKRNNCSWTSVPNKGQCCWCCYFQKTTKVSSGALGCIGRDDERCHQA